MDKISLFALSAVDGRYKNKTTELRSCFSEYALIKKRLEIEIKWLLHLSNNKEIPELSSLDTEKNKLLSILNNFNIDEALRIKEIERQTNHDVKAIEYYLKDKLNELNLDNKILNFIHFACTSEDINNLAYALILKESYSVLTKELNSITIKIKQLAHQEAHTAMLSRTHGQPASPTTLGKEMANFYNRLQQAQTTCQSLPFYGKINGAVGNYNAHVIAYPNVNWPQIAQDFVESLGLTFNAYTTQIEPHDYIAQLAYASTQINTILLDFTRDIWGYIALNYFNLKINNQEVGSSTMPHKVNPIDFENAEGNLGVSNALLLHYATKLPISRWQRDLSDSTVLRSIGTALGHTLIAYQSLTTGINKLSVNHELISQDLNQHWEILAEPIQTIMRKHGVTNPYEKLKQLTRGENINANNFASLLKELNLPQAAYNEIKSLTPQTYIGLAKILTEKIT